MVDVLGEIGRGLSGFTEGFQTAQSRQHDVFQQASETETLRQQQALQEALKGAPQVEFIQNPNGTTTVDPASLRAARDHIYETGQQYLGPAGAIELRQGFMENYEALGNQYLNRARAALTGGDTATAIDAFNAATAFIPDGNLGRVAQGADGNMYWQVEDEEGNVVDGGPVGPQELAAYISAYRDFDKYFEQQQTERRTDIAEFSALSQDEARRDASARGWAQFNLDRAAAAAEAGFGADDLDDLSSDLWSMATDMMDAAADELPTGENLAEESAFSPDNITTTVTMAENFALAAPGISRSQAMDAARSAMVGEWGMVPGPNGELMVRTLGGVEVPVTGPILQMLYSIAPDKMQELEASLEGE